MEMEIYERSLQALLSSAPRSRFLARFAQIGELARRIGLSLPRSQMFLSLEENLRAKKGGKE